MKRCCTCLLWARFNEKWLISGYSSLRTYKLVINFARWILNFRRLFPFWKRLFGRKWYEKHFELGHIIVNQFEFLHSNASHWNIFYRNLINFGLCKNFISPEAEFIHICKSALFPKALCFLRCGPLTGEVIRDTMKIFRKGQGSFGHIRVRDEDNINLNSSPRSSGGFCADRPPLRTTVRGGNLISCPDGCPTSPSLATRADRLLCTVESQLPPSSHFLFIHLARKVGPDRNYCERGLIHYANAQLI